MPGNAAEHAVERGVAFAGELHPAAAPVRESDYAIDVGILLQLLGSESCGDILADRCRTIHRGNDGNVISRARRAVGTAIAIERAAGERRRVGRDFAGRRIVTIELSGGQIVRVDPCARSNVLRGEANDLAVLDHRLLHGNRRQRDLVTQLHRAGQPHGIVPGGNLGAGGQIARRHTDVVSRVEVDGIDRPGVDHRVDPTARRGVPPANGATAACPAKPPVRNAN